MFDFASRPDLSARTGFATNPVDRRAAQRDDAAFIADAAQRPDARTILMVRDRPVLRDGEPLFPLAEADAIAPAVVRVFLGERGPVPIFATLLADERASEMVDDGGRATWTLPGHPSCQPADLRGLTTAGEMPADLIGLLGQAKSLLHWHKTHAFCARCGNESRSVAGGWRRDCPRCGALHFPRTDPVVIMLAIHRDRCLLGRQPRFAPLSYSALAGFLEPGETIEDAVRREIGEESGVPVGRVAYLASQPWPFPASLMIGCFAEALDDHLTVDHSELEDARWFDRVEARSMLDLTHPGGLRAPAALAIAHTLLQAFVAS